MDIQAQISSTRRNWWYLLLNNIHNFYCNQLCVQFQTRLSYLLRRGSCSGWQFEQRSAMCEETGGIFCWITFIIFTTINCVWSSNMSTRFHHAEWTLNTRRHLAESNSVRFHLLGAKLIWSSSIEHNISTCFNKSLHFSDLGASFKRKSYLRDVELAGWWYLLRTNTCSSSNELWSSRTHGGEHRSSRSNIAWSIPL